MEKIESKFIRYVKIDTESSETSKTYPSTAKQLDLARLLKKELIELGVKDVIMDEYGLVYAHLDGEKDLPTIGLIAHMDTAPTIRGGNYEPRVVTNYAGNDIKLNATYTLSPKQFPHLLDLKGKTLIVTDGDHLLGGDDKAGVAIIMSIVEYYINHPSIKHCPIAVCFTPDEEIGGGPLHFDVKKMHADYAYTLDGGPSWDINYENFNASSAVVSIKGVGIHPGSAKGIMVNASLLAMEFNAQLDPDAIPAKTEGYQGFNHLCEIKGDIETCEMGYIIRDHDEKKLHAKEKEFIRIGQELQKKYPTSEVKVTIIPSYKNMRNYFDKDKTAINAITKAYDKVGIKYTFSAIRGGTDGATITYMGLPCPNIGNGDRCCHGRYEHVVVEEMYQVFDVVKALLEQ